MSRMSASETHPARTRTGSVGDDYRGARLGSLVRVIPGQLQSPGPGLPSRDEPNLDTTALLKYGVTRAIAKAASKSGASIT